MAKLIKWQFLRVEETRNEEITGDIRIPVFKKSLGSLKDETEIKLFYQGRRSDKFLLKVLHFHFYNR